jgi:hypothetical protein
MHTYMLMHITYQAADSRMQGRIHENATFLLYLTPGSTAPEVTLTGAEVTQIIAHHVMLSHQVLNIAAQVQQLPTRDLYPKRRLIGQHKALKGR